MILRLVIFLALNFGALAVGGLFTGKGVPSDWYVNLNKAPWTPPGWVFGFAWTTIMICYSFFMAYLWPKTELRSLTLSLFIMQWILNIAWNPAFFHFHAMLWALVIIVLLTANVFAQGIVFRQALGYKVYLIAPYAFWLVIATSLNAYTLIKN